MFYDNIIKDHLTWLNDAGRNSFYKKHITENVSGKTCIDVGAGTGILTDYALQAGAKKVYAVEIRKSRANFLKEKYADNPLVKVIEANFLDTEIKDKIDFVFLEQVGCQFANNFTLKTFMQEVKNNYSGAKTIPEKYCLKAYVFDEIVEEMPQVLVRSSTLPDNFYDHCQKFKKYKEVEVKEVCSVDVTDCEKEIGFELDLESFGNCTVFIDDVVKYDSHEMEVENTYRDWRKHKPYRLEVEGKAIRKIIWNGTDFEAL